MLLGDVKAVDPVECRELVSGCDENGFPIVVARLERQRADRFDHDDHRLRQFEVHRPDDVAFGSFDVDGHEVDRLVGSVLANDVRQRPGRD